MVIVENRYSKKNPKSKKVLLNPHDKEILYSDSLKANKRAYIDAETGEEKYGKKDLSNGCIDYRRGYIQARKDSRKAYKYNQNQMGVNNG